MKSTGKLIYSPKTHLNNSKWWAILSCDEEFCKYYSYLYSKQYPYCNANYNGKIVRPIWGAHISFLRNEKPRNDLWEIDKNKLIDFEYIPGILDNKEHFWLNIKCDYLLNLRERYGLEREPKFGLHLTVARIAG